MSDCPALADDGSSGESSAWPSGCEGRLLLLMEGGANQQVVSDWLRERYHVVAGAGAESLREPFDLCLVDEGTFARHRDALAARKAREDGGFLPVLVVAGSHSDLASVPQVWEVADDVVTAPLRKAELAARIGNLLDRRAESRRLVREGIEGLCRKVATAYPDATVEWDLPETDLVLCGGVQIALGEVLDNALKHNDAPEPRVEVTVAEDTPGRVDVTVVDNGPGVPEHEWRAVRAGTESQLRHATGVGLWLVDWVVRMVGGSVDLSLLDSGGTRVSLRLPAERGPAGGG